MTTRNEKIRNLLAASKKPMTIAEIAKALKESKNKVHVSNHLRSLWKNGEIERCDNYQPCSIEKKDAIAYRAKTAQKEEKPKATVNIHVNNTQLPELVQYVLLACGYDQNQIKLVEMVKNLRMPK